MPKRDGGRELIGHEHTMGLQTCDAPSNFSSVIREVCPARGPGPVNREGILDSQVPTGKVAEGEAINTPWIGPLLAR